MLNVENINVYYGKIHALKDVSLTVKEGEIVALIGANGAGKSTTLKTISGLLRPRSGKITLYDRDITRVNAYKMVAKGLAQVPEGRCVFLQMTVQENLEMGAYTQSSFIKESLNDVYALYPKLKHLRKRIASTLEPEEQQMLALAREHMCRPQVTLSQDEQQASDSIRINPEKTVLDNLTRVPFAKKSSVRQSLADVYERFPRLKHRKNQIAGTLSGGEQQMLAMGRALMSHPKLLMMDEPSMGLAPILVEQIFDIIRELHQSGTTILLVEQNAEMALRVADRAYVLETGTIKLSGKASDLLNDDSVRKAYLGG